MRNYNESSAYPHPEDFAVMRPEYSELSDGFYEATITVSPFRVSGKSATKPGARRAALYEAAKTYHNYHPSYRVESPYPDKFVDQQDVRWERIPQMQRNKLGDYRFIDENGEEDFADIEQMLMWDVRPSAVTEEG